MEVGGPLPRGGGDRLHCAFISQKVFMESFCKSQFPHKFVNLFLIMVIISHLEIDGEGGTSCREGRLAAGARGRQSPSLCSFGRRACKRGVGVRGIRLNSSVKIKGVLRS